MKEAGFGGASGRTPTRTPKSGYLARKFPENRTIMKVERVIPMVDSEIGQRVEEIEEQRDFSFQLVATMLLFLFALGIAERTVYFVDPVQGLFLHAGILVVLILYVSARWDQSQYRYLLGLSIVPIMRIISLALPLQYFPLAFWYGLASLVLSVALLMFAQRLEFTRLDLGINLKIFPVQFLVGLGGILIGVGHYFILRPSLPISGATLAQRTTLGLVFLVCNGFIEELIFRGMLQHIAEKILDHRLAWLYVAGMYSILTLGSYSLGSVAFTFVISLFFSWIVSRTGSISGVSLAHGLASITLFLIMPGLSL